jgi:integrase
MSAYLVPEKGWRYDCRFMNARITGAWFKTELDALIQEGIRKEQLKNQSRMPAVTQTDTDFLTLCNKRLDALKSRTPRYYEENQVFLKKMLVLWGNPMCSQISREMVREHFTRRPFMVIEKKGKDGNGKKKKGKMDSGGRKKSKADNSAREDGKAGDDIGHNAIANYELKMLRAAFNFGIECKIVSNNPTTAIKFLPKTNKQKRYVPPVDNIWSLLQAALTPKKTKNEKAREREAIKSYMDYVYVTVIMLTLARVGEINRLEWPDISFDHRFLKLYTKKKKDGSLTPRNIPMHDWILGLLLSLYKRRDPSVSWVFHHRYWSRKEGRFIVGPYKDRKKLMTTLCKKAKIKYFRYHPLRHFGATMLAALGVPLAEIQLLLGHEDIATTQRYIHSLVGADRQAMEAFAKKLLESFHTIHTRQEKQGASPEANPLFLLVGRTGIEPATR